MSSQPMRVVVRALDVLTVLAQDRDGRTLQQLHQELDIPIGSMHRLLSTLNHAEFVTRSSTNGRHFLGRKSRALAATSTSIGTQLVNPPPALNVASVESGETVFLTELMGDTPICVSLVESRQHALRLFVHIGQELPLHAAASSRAILAYQPEDKVRKILANSDLKSFTVGTPRTVTQVLHQLKEVRKHGYDVCDSELDDNVWAVSAPVRSADGSVSASVTLAAAGTRMEHEQVRQQALETILRASEELSTQLGAGTAPAGGILA